MVKVDELVIDVRAIVDKAIADLNRVKNVVNDVIKQQDEIARRTRRTIDHKPTVSGAAGRVISQITGKIGGGIGQVGTQIAGLATAAGPLGLVVAGITAIVTVLKLIHDKIEKMFNVLKEASPAFKGTKDLVEKTWLLAMKPLADFISILMRPYIIMAMQYLRAQLPKMYEALKASGGQITPEVMNIWQGTMAGLGSIFQQMMNLIQPFAAQMEGFLTGIGTVFNNWLTGISDWFNGLLAGIGQVFSPMPDSLANWIMDSIKKNSSYLEKIPKNVVDKFFEWIAVNPQNFINLPTDVQQKMLDWLSSGGWENLPLDVALKLLEWLTKYGVGITDFPKRVGDQLFTQVVSTAKDIQSGVTNSFDIISTQISVLAPSIKATVYNAFIDIVNSLISVYNSIVNKIRSMPIIGHLAPKTQALLPYMTIQTELQQEIDKILGFSVQDLINKWNAEHAMQFGGTIPETGLFLLHKGEKVVPTSKPSEMAKSEISKVTIFKPNYEFSGKINKEVDIDSMIRRSHRIAELDLRRRGLI